MVAQSIPRKLMQTWKEKSVPMHWAGSPESINKFMPQWEYTLMTDEMNRAFIKLNMPDFLPYYDAFPYPIQRADAIRYVYLYVNGGVYMDLDIVVQKPMDELFVPMESKNLLYLVSSGNFGQCITNSFMASSPRHPIWLEVIEEMKKPVPWWALTKHFIVMTSTGPMALDRVVKRGKYNYLSLPSKYLTGCTVCEKTCIIPNAFLTYNNSGSWNGWDSLLLNFLLCNYKSILWVILLLILVVLLLLFFWIQSRRRK